MTLAEGIYKVDISKKRIDRVLAIRGCIGNALVLDKMVYVFRGYGIACVHPNGDIRIVGGGLVSTLGLQCHLFAANNHIYAISSGHIRMEGVDEFNPMITILGEQLGDEGRFTIPGFEPGQSIKAAFVNESSVLVASSLPKWFIGCFTLVDLTGSSKPVWTGTESKRALSVMRLNERYFLAALQGVSDLLSFHPETKAIIGFQGIELLMSDIEVDIPSIVAGLNLPGNSVELTHSAYGGGYLLSDYSRNKEGSKAVLVRWQYTANNRLAVVH